MTTSQSSATQETDSRPLSHLWFTTEIQHMMFGFGDCSKPLVESATLIEDIVYRQMSQLLYHVEVIAHKRSSRFIGIEDFLFLLRKNKVKLHRILRFLEFKDVKTAAIKAVNFEEDEAAVEGDPKQQQHRKRRKICHDFFSIIDQTGELAALMDDPEDDEIKRERKIRAEILTRNMTTQQYLEYCEARQASFTPRYKMQKFKDWVLSGVTLDIKPNAYAMEILSYLAYETVAEIVDMALIVKRDKNVTLGDPFSHEMAPVCMNYETLAPKTSESAVVGGGSLLSPSLSSTNALMSPQTPKASNAGTPSTSLFGSGSSVNLTNKARKKKVVSQQSRDLITAQAITTDDIYEALRRFCQPIGPFADFSKLPLIAVGQRLLCC